MDISDLCRYWWFCANNLFTFLQKELFSTDLCFCLVLQGRISDDNEKYQEIMILLASEQEN